MMVDYATVQLRRSTKQRLSDLRQPGESYDAAMQRIMDEATAQEEQRFLAEVDAIFEDEDAFEPIETAWPTKSS